MSTGPRSRPARRVASDRRVIDLLLDHGALDRPSIARMAGLSRPSAGELVSRLAADGVVREVGAAATGRRGPNAVLYGLTPGLAVVAGLELHPDHAGASVADVAGDPLATAEARARPGEAPEHLAVRVLGDAAAAAGANPRALRTVTIATPGIVGTDGDMSYVQDHPGWHAGLRTRLQDALGVHVHLENDVKLAALAERRAGCAADAESFVLLRCDESVSAAVVLGDRVVRGAHGAAGEIGYLPSAGPGGPADLKDVLGAVALRRALVGTVAEGRTPEDVLAGRGTAEVARAALFEDVAHRLALAVAATCSVVDPELVVLTGSVAAAGGPELAEAVERAVRSRTPFRPRVELSALCTSGPGPAVLGAVLSALDSTRDEVYGIAPVYLPAGPPLSGSRGRREALDDPEPTP